MAPDYEHFPPVAVMTHTSLLKSNANCQGDCHLVVVPRGAAAVLAPVANTCVAASGRQPSASELPAPSQLPSYSQLSQGAAARLKGKGVDHAELLTSIPPAAAK